MKVLRFSQQFNLRDFWSVTLCHQMDCSRHFEGMVHLNSQGSSGPLSDYYHFEQLCIFHNR